MQQDQQVQLTLVVVAVVVAVKMLDQEILELVVMVVQE
jgi:hypothetical protein